MSDTFPKILQPSEKIHDFKKELTKAVHIKKSRGGWFGGLPPKMNRAIDMHGGLD